MTIDAKVTITKAKIEDGLVIANIHLAARRLAMPHLRQAHTDEETRAYFKHAVAETPETWWTVRHEGQVVAFMRMDGQSLDHLYVSPDQQGYGLGSALLDKAKALSSGHIILWTFQCNERARAFYEARGFLSIRETEGDNEEREPDVQYEWRRELPSGGE